MRPFLKWAGGKSWLFNDRKFHIPPFDGVYREPFLGGGAAFFSQLPKKAALSDENKSLIELYQVMKSNPSKLKLSLMKHEKAHCRDYYYYLRSSNFNSKLDRAAKFLYLNRTCWNGLYRVNNLGEFNVPIGSKSSVIYDTDDFEGWSNALKTVEIRAMDFEQAIDKANDGDLIFADPPYTVRHNHNGFLQYNQKIFSWDDQVRLRDSLKRARARGAHFILTNANHQSVRELYSEFTNTIEVERRSGIAASNKFRGRVTEIIVTSYPPNPHFPHL